MGVDAGMPLGLMERIRKIVGEELARFARSGFLRNASISDGGLTIKGGFLRLLSKAAGGTTLFYIGPTGDALPDGTPQQGWIVRRGDGTVVLDMYDADVSDGQLNQALNWRDRAGSTVIADDTDSGQGIARPYVPASFYPARNSDWPAIADTTFVTVWRAVMPKQQPRLFVGAWGFSDTPGATGELRVIVNGAQLGDTVTTSNNAVGGHGFGPAPVAGAHMSTLTVEIQARVVSGGGAVQVGASQVQGQQS